MKQIGNHGEIDAPEPDGPGEGARSSARESFIVVPIDDDFDIDSVFRSEQETVEAEVDAVATASAGAILVRVDPDPIPGDRSTAPEPASRDRPKAPSLSIADLIDNHVRLEWHEAVAIAQHLCRVMARDPGANIRRSLVEPWNVEITNAGEVQVLPGGSSSDPLVRQVGRVLRALLQDAIAPAELRLVASQASFEVPVYSSVDEFSAALRHFERAGDSDDIRAAFNRGLEAKFSDLPTYARVAAAARPQPSYQNVQTVQTGQHDQPRRVPAASSVLRRSSSKRSAAWMLAVGAAIAVSVAATAVLVVFGRAHMSVGKAEGRAEVRPVAPMPEPRGPQAATASRTPPAPHDIVPAPSLSSATVSTRGPDPEHVAPPVTHRVIRPLIGPPTVSLPPTSSPSPRSGAPVEQPAASGDSPEAAERRAASLFASGRAGEAAVILDALVMRNPLYQLDPARSSPEALAAFLSSKRLLLPAMARRYYQEARAAFDAGDFSQAITKGGRALALLNDADVDPGAGDLSGEVSNFLTLASTAQTIEDARIYTAADREVTPPRPLGRQLSTASLSGRPPSTGRLELVVGRSGQVEAVKLDTPLNGYHDRMIVSAAKAWRYRPALKKGKPVRFSLVMPITLPDF